MRYWILGLGLYFFLTSVIGFGCSRPTEGPSGSGGSSASSPCSLCHGSDLNSAPPKDTKGKVATTLVSVGAHQAHLNPQLSQPVECEECHIVPREMLDPGHILGEPARVNFGNLASLGTTSQWDRNQANCNVYCHGPTLLGGTATRPVWNRVDGSQKKCDSCHGNPPANYPDEMGHYDGAPCGACHVGYGTNTINKATHINGTVDVEQNCLACHSARELCLLNVHSFCPPR